jgi:hypothetical protein
MEQAILVTLFLFTVRTPILKRNVVQPDDVDQQAILRQRVISKWLSTKLLMFVVRSVISNSMVSGLKPDSTGIAIEQFNISPAGPR